MRQTLLLCSVLLGSAAFAEEPTPPPVMPAEPVEAALPATFLDQALKVDQKNQVTEGRAAKPISHLELYERMGRVDLVEQSRAAASRRTWLIVSSIGLAVAGISVGSVLVATAPNLATPYCENDVRIYNEICVPQHRDHTISGVAVIASSVAASLVLAGFAYGANPDVLDRDQTTALVSSYNSRLAKQLRAKPSGLRLMPFITPDGASLTASLRF